MIGGMDTTFAVHSGPVALDVAARLVSRWWPDCVFVADDEATGTGDFDRIALHDRSEVIIYRDATAEAAWDDLGYDDSLKGTMVYKLADADSLTVFTEHDPCPPIVTLTAAIGACIPTAFPAPDLYLEAA